MAIDLTNYEAWFLDYHEGNLDPAALRELERFLEAHPDLRKELNAFDNVPLEVPSMAFPRKDLLHKPGAGHTSYASWFIAWHEGDLSSAEMKEVEAFLETHPTKRAEFEACRKLKLLPDYTVVFSGKGSLKRIAPAFPARTWMGYAAAAVVALFLLTYFLLRNTVISPGTLAEKPIVQEPATLPVSHPASAASTVQPVIHRADVQRKTKVKASIIQPSPHSAPAPIHNDLARTEQVNPLPVAESMPVKNVAVTAPLTSPDTSVSSSRPSRQQLLQVFTEEDMAELGLESKPVPGGKSIWDLVEKGARSMSRMTETEITLDRQSNSNGDSYTFAVGRFSISHSSSK